MSTITAKKLFTVSEYLLMAKTGILSEGDRVELIRGEVLTMSPIGPRHGAAVDHALIVLAGLIGDRAILRVQGSVVLDQFDQPQPDLVLLRPRTDFYVSKNPGPHDILLIIEVSDSSLEYDQTIKLPLYAEMGITEYWIADLRNNRLFAYSKPKGNAYSVLREFTRDDEVHPQALPECTFPASVLLP